MDNAKKNRKRRRKKKKKKKALVPTRPRFKAVQTHVDAGVQRGRHCDDRGTPVWTNVTYCRSRLALCITAVTPDNNRRQWLRQRRQCGVTNDRVGGSRVLLLLFFSARSVCEPFYCRVKGAPFGHLPSFYLSFFDDATATLRHSPRILLARHARPAIHPRKSSPSFRRKYLDNSQTTRPRRRRFREGVHCATDFEKLRSYSC